ncbi:MAG: AAA family ATPase [Pyrinomonadaceae bacterium]
MQVILKKIETPTESPSVSRPRLLKTLHESLTSCTSTIITGRRGTGKTFLATDFAHHSERRASWYKVDASDSDLHIFFPYLVESVRRQCPGFGKEALARLADTSGPEDIPSLAEAFLYDLQECQREPLLIVIDDLHLIYDAQWVVPFFRRMLPLLPAEAHVFIIGRSIPPAPLWRMRSKQILCLIEESELAFNLHEANELFDSYDLAQVDARAMLEQAHGRASVLDAMARKLSQIEHGGVETFAGEKTFRRAELQEARG